MKELIFYHSADLDGHCSGAITKLARPQAELIGIDYGEDFPWEQIKNKPTVYMVDFSLQPSEDMIRLNVNSFLTWIDHHKSAIESVITEISGIRDSNLAACELCWQYFFKDKPLSVAVQLLGRYDVWDKENPEWQSRILSFQKGFKDYYEITDPGHDGCGVYWPDLFVAEPENATLISEIISTGHKALRRIGIQNQIHVEKFAYPVQFEGLRGIACNKGITNSQLFDSVWDESTYDIMITYIHVQGRYWTVSLYSTKEDVDVSLIAKKYGGGGHKGAAGFQCKELPFVEK